jgi:UDPglucose--hexose-1-phosphate uridylyltransferase
LGEILAEWDGPHPCGWSARAVRNAHPAYPEPARHEVLIETPRHHVDLDAFSAVEAERWVQLYLERSALAMESTDLGVFAFRNRGRDAGASLRHPHGQLWAVPGATPAHTRRGARLRAWQADAGACLLCRPPEPGVHRRTVHEGEHLRVEVPWAAVEPWHMRVIPRHHLTSWTLAGADLKAALARLLPPLVAALRRVAGDPDWNLTFHDFGTVPHPGLHAHLEILPRHSRLAGFELATGVRVNEGLPLSDADDLRRVLRTSPDDPLP